MKPVTLSDRQMQALMTLGKAVDDALVEFRGKTPAEVATAAHSAYASMLALSLPSPGLPASVPTPAPVKRKPKAKKTAAKKATATMAKSSDRTVSIVSVLNKAKEPIPASAIAEELGVPGQGLGPVLNMLHTDGVITKKDVDGTLMWGPKKGGSKLNGASHPN